MPYSGPYLIFVASLLALSALELSLHWSEGDLRRFNWAALAGFIFFFGGRNLIGWDWTNYYLAFEDAVPLHGFLRYSDWDFDEPAFNLFMSVIKTFTSKFWVFVFCSTVINGLLLHLFLTRYLPRKYYTFGMAIFLVVYGFTFATDLMRNYTGLMVFLFAIPYIEKRQWYYFFPLLIVGCLFHWSIAILGICYFFLHRIIPLKVAVVIFIVANIIFLAGLPAASLIVKGVARLFPAEQQETILTYVDNSLFNQEYGISLGYLERTLMCLLVFYYYPKLTENVSIRMFVNAFFVFVLICLTCYEYNIFITRFGALFGFGCWILYPILIEHLEKPFKPVLWVVLSVIILMKMNTLTNNVLYKYENVFIHHPISSYEHRKEIFDNHYDQLMK